MTSFDLLMPQYLSLSATTLQTCQEANMSYNYQWKPAFGLGFSLACSKAFSSSLRAVAGYVQVLSCLLRPFSEAPPNAAEYLMR